MNGDTPGAVPSDDFPFLGPAVSPRRRDAGTPPQEASELAAPFVGGMFRSSPHEAAPAPEERLPDATEQETGPAADDGLDQLPAADWPADDFPWLMPDEPEGAAAADDAPWRATGEVEELTAPPTSVSGEEDPDVRHFGWIGEQYPPAADAAQPQAPAEPVGEPTAGDSEGSRDFGWEGEPGLASEPADVSDFAAEAEGEAERAGFRVDDESSEDSWQKAVEWSPEPEATEWVRSGADEAPAEDESAPEFSATSFSWDEESEEVEPVAADRWDAGDGFRVEDESGAAGGAALEEEDRAEEDRAEGGAGAETMAAPVEAAALPVGEWEPAADTGAADEAVAGQGGVGETDAALVEVADRLERIARSLRGGNPIEAVEEGDPLQLLITGYALGYAQSRKRGR